MNPCPCGYFCDERRSCRCSPPQVQPYRGRLSGPLRDRLDFTVDVVAVPWQDLTHPVASEPSAVVRQRVVRARERQRARLAGTGVTLNAGLTPRLLRETCLLDADTSRLLGTASERLGLSARACHRVLKVARTIADLDGRDLIGSRDAAEALQFRLVE